MVTTHNLGFPRIGGNRELKFALESLWQGKTHAANLQATAEQLRARHWAYQKSCDYRPVGDFSLYDHVLDTSFLLGNIPERAGSGDTLQQYFRVARGRAHNTDDCGCTRAGEMTKWFDTNYHYIVPEFDAQTQFALNPERLLGELSEARQQGGKVKPVLLGPVTYLWLGKARDGSNKLDLLESLLEIYSQLLQRLEDAGVEWVQLDEPILATDLSPEWKQALERSCHRFKTQKINLLLSTYFGALEDNLQLACTLPVAGLHIDAINNPKEVTRVVDWLPAHKVLSLGVIDGRNIWKTDLNAALEWLQPLADKRGDGLWLAPSCSLLHVPVDLTNESALDPEIKSWLSFAVQKLEELAVLAKALNHGCESVAQALEDNKAAILGRRSSTRVHNASVQAAMGQINAEFGQRRSPFPTRAALQRQALNLPEFPTTTIGSFPQTDEIRSLRRRYKLGELQQMEYERLIKQEIERAVSVQEELGLDVLVHGEAERNDMVEYFGEQLQGYAFSEKGWVQSYGSRCVKPPILYGDISRPSGMTLQWIQYAQSLTQKPLKGMLTGPVTMLNWSFVRDDQKRSRTALQLALAIREEVQQLEAAGIQIIQIDEAALREGLPLRRTEWQGYLDWAVEAYRISANGVSDSTQIHTHMCYSEFNDIIAAVAQMDADVITIESSRSDMELLNAFEKFSYPNDIGPGVYDIHSPNIPTVEQIVENMRRAAQRIPAERLWVNPDCGLKTRKWDEVLPALSNMVSAARALRDVSEPAETNTLMANG